MITYKGKITDVLCHRSVCGAVVISFSQSNAK